MAHQHHRIYTFDLLRGIAVLTMMLAHSVYFFHARDSSFLLSLEGFGNIVSFVTFLLVSGAVAAVAYGGRKQLPDRRLNPRRVFNRVLLLLLAYYLLIFLITGPELLRTEGLARLQLVFDLLSFRFLPGFTEYFPPFIFYATLLGFFPRVFFTISRSLKNLTIVSLVAWLAGWLVYQLPVGELLKPWVALLAGSEGFFRFPLLQYLPVFLIGMYWGHRTLVSHGLPAKQQLSSRLFWFFALVAAVAFVGSLLMGLPLESTFLRWPPSVPFLALGLAFAFLMTVILYAVRQLRQVRLLRDLLLTFGQNALGLFWSHIFLLSLYAIAGGTQVSSPGIFLFLFLLLILLSLALTTFLPFNFRLALTSIRGSHEEHEEMLAEQAIVHLSQDLTTEAVQAKKGLREYFFPDPRTTSRQILRKRHKVGLSLVALAAAAVILPATIEEINLHRQQQRATVWWSDTYAYRQPVSLQTTESFTTIQSGSLVRLQFNHQNLVAEGKSRFDGQDVKLVYWNGQEHLVADSAVEHTNSFDASLAFKAPVDIRAGKTEGFYYLYYGGFIATPSANTPFEATTTVQATFGSEQSFPLIAHVTKSWSLIGEPGDATIAFQVTTSGTYNSPSMTYQVMGTPITGVMNRLDELTWEATIPVATLAPGSYRLQATVNDGDIVQTSQQTGFYRSYPLYVAWTQDWEGYDASQAYLDAIEAIASEYHLPLTHFFNPRIYVTETMSSARAQALTQWVKRRLGLGDALALHLHMFTDFVEQVGIEPKTEPNWGDRGDGYGVPMTAYSQAEQQQIIQKGLDLMVANGFAKPDIFRADGWFANLDTLAALEALGFKADSSARTAYTFGRNKLKGYWNVPATAKPYLPSRTDQNHSAATNTFRLLEIPNNGADSYAFSAAQMIERFTMNFGDGILDDKQQLTYLTHPHWFDAKEQARVRELLSFVSQHTASNDRGPVIFTTTNQITDLWTNGQ